MCVQGHMCHSVLVEAQGQLGRVGSLLSTCMSLGSKFDCEAWKQALPLMTLLLAMLVSFQSA